MDLAEKLCISYQAVSSWERGETLPDVSKLPELSGILNESMDVILGNENMKEEKITTIESEKQPVDSTSGFEAQVLVKPLEALHSLIGKLPFLERDKADELVGQIMNEGYSLKAVIPVFPSVSQQVVDALVLTSIKDSVCYPQLLGALPFMSQHVIDDIIVSELEKGATTKELEMLFPFVSTHVIEHVHVTK